MRKFSLFLIVMIILSCVNVCAADQSVENGTVLYHQDFSEVSKLSYSGIKIGTQSNDSAFVDCTGASLDINFAEKGRVYLILPDTERTASYTVEFSFSFNGHVSNNGYLSFILTCRGEEPTNVSEVIIRHNGTVDDFAEPDPALTSAIASGETVLVSIPVENNVLHEIHMTVGDTTYTLSRDKVLVLSNENFGFAARNTNVSIDEIFVVSGVEYVEKTGYYSENSFATDENPVIAEGDTAPNTSDDMPSIVWIAGGSAVVLLLIVLLCKKSK